MVLSCSETEILHATTCTFHNAKTVAFVLEGALKLLLVSGVGVIKRLVAGT